MPTPRQKATGAAAATAVVMIIIVPAVGTGRHQPAPRQSGSGCIARSNGFSLELSTGQAAIAATIAGVARQRSMPERAVIVAYAAALQESGLENLGYGDKDSVGIFQQRPSQGWGRPRQLLDPVYASSRFFAALAAVPGYQHLRIYQAAQAVQHSADGYAYGQYTPMGRNLAGPFTGSAPHGVWCWSYPPVSGARRLRAASRELTRTFGPLDVVRSGGAGLAVQPGAAPGGWAVAAWLVTHAGSYGIRRVSYRGYQWSAGRGTAGWTADPAGHPGSTAGASPPVKFS